MTGKISILIISILVLSACSREEKPIITTEPKVYTEKYLLEITRDFEIKKISFSSYDTYRNYTLEYFYYADSVAIINQVDAGRTVYFLNKSGLADSSQHFSNFGPSNTKLYFTYDPNGYLIAEKQRYLNSSLEFTDRYEYNSGNLTRVIFDPKKPSLQSGKYVSYTYNALQNLVDIRGFKGSWLGKLNTNLAKTYFVGGSMSDVPPCQNYEYNLNAKGLVETMTIFPCNSSSNYKTIVSFEYKIKD